MTFRPIDTAFVSTCSKQVDCLDCPLRIGCRLRYDFYQVKDSSSLQQLLTQASAPLAKRIPPDKFKQLNVQMKHKWMVERLNHPNGYQYNG